MTSKCPMLLLQAKKPGSSKTKTRMWTPRTTMTMPKVTTKTDSPKTNATEISSKTQEYSPAFYTPKKNVVPPQSSQATQHNPSSLQDCCHLCPRMQPSKSLECSTVHDYGALTARTPGLTSPRALSPSDCTGSLGWVTQLFFVHTCFLFLFSWKAPVFRVSSVLCLYVFIFSSGNSWVL